MAKVYAISSLDMKHKRNSADEPRDEHGVLQHAWYRYSWNNPQEYDKIVIKHSQWDSVKSKWVEIEDTLLKPSGGSVANTWNFDILATGWTPDTGKFLSKLVVSITPYVLNAKGKYDAGIKTTSTFTFTPVAKLKTILPNLEFSYEDEENAYAFSWSLDVKGMTQANKQLYENALIFNNPSFNNLSEKIIKL